MSNYLYDENKIRFNLVASNIGMNYNWLFLPGGPGADSAYLKSLTDILSLPGNVWLIDLPGNGNNEIDTEFNYDSWLKIFIPLLQKFSHPILVGHSFGAMLLPLLFPETENYLSGFVSLNSAPTLWLEAAANIAIRDGLPDLTEDMQTFTARPTPQTFQKALLACMPYYFPANSIEQGVLSR